MSDYEAPKKTAKSALTSLSDSMQFGLRQHHKRKQCQSRFKIVGTLRHRSGGRIYKEAANGQIYRNEPKPWANKAGMKRWKRCRTLTRNANRDLAMAS